MLQQIDVAQTIFYYVLNASMIDMMYNAPIGTAWRIFDIKYLLCLGSKYELVILVYLTSDVDNDNVIFNYHAPRIALKPFAPKQYNGESV